MSNEKRRLVCRDTREWVYGEEVTWNHCQDCYEYDCPIHRINERLLKIEESMGAEN